MENDQLLDTLDAAAFLRIDQRTLENWRYRGGGPKFLRYGAPIVRYRVADLRDFMERAAVEPKAAAEK